MNYADYHPNIPHHPVLTEYDVRQDWTGPLFFAPDQCRKDCSFMIPRRSSPIIAIIDHDNEVQEGVQDYYKAIFRWQLPYVIPLLLPHYKFEIYKSKEELFNYISSEDYLKTSDTKGICFGFEIIKHADNDWEAKLYFND